MRILAWSRALPERGGKEGEKREETRGEGGKREYGVREVRGGRKKRGGRRGGGRERAMRKALFI